MAQIWFWNFLSKYFTFFFKIFHSIIPLINISSSSHTCSVQKITPDRLISEVCDIHFGTSIGEKWDRQSYQIAALLFSKSEFIQSGKDKCSLFVRLYKFVLPLSSFKVHVNAGHTLESNDRFVKQNCKLCFWWCRFLLFIQM